MGGGDEYDNDIIWNDGAHNDNDNGRRENYKSNIKTDIKTNKSVDI